MILPVVVFVGVLAIVFGAYWLIVVRPEAEERAALRRRLEPQKVTKARRLSIMKEVEHLSSVPAIHNLLLQRESLVAPLQKLIEQSAVRVTVSVLLLGAGCLGLGGYLLASLLLGSRFFGLVAGAALGYLPFLFVQFKRDKRVRQFEELFPEALDLLTRSMRAGHAFTTGLAMVAEELPQPIAGEFKLLYDRQNYGLPLEEALRDFGQRVPLLDAKFFVTAVITQRDAGGNLSEVLDNLSSVIRERFTVKRTVRAKSAHGRITGWILAALPPCLALAFFVMSPKTMKLLFEDPLGVRMVIAALVLQLIGTLVIRKIVNIEY